jgi:hypothetical protein
MSHYCLLVDFENRSLLDNLTTLTSAAMLMSLSFLLAMLLLNSNDYHVH